MAFIAFLLALILLVVGVHTGWVIWLVVVGGLLLSLGQGFPTSWQFWKRT
jgi:hypothetical protein